MKVRAVNWTLEKIYPTFGDLLTNLDHWFEMPRLQTRYGKRRARWAGWRYHKGQLPRFTQQDRRKGSKWRSHVAKRLFAVRRVVIEMCEELHSAEYPLWLLRNCRPSGGKWSPDASYPGNPTGKPCRHYLCPWCYLRRFHDLMRIALWREGSTVQCQYQNREVKGMGLTHPLNLTLFEARGDQMLLSAPSYAEFQSRVGAAIKHRFEQRNGVTVRSVVPELRRALRLFSIQFEDPLYVLRMGYLHNEPLAEPHQLRGDKKDSLVGELRMSRYDQLRVEDALRIAQPFPINLLTGIPEGRHIVEAMFRRRAWASINPGRLPSPSAAPGCEPYSASSQQSLASCCVPQSP